MYEQLGRVKGENGDVYTPIIVDNEDGTQKIRFTLTNPEANELDNILEYNIKPKVYKPLVENGELKFILTDLDEADFSVDIDNIKGEKGDTGTFNISMVNSFPDPGTLQSENDGTLYVTPDGTAKIYNHDIGQLIDLENDIKFNNFYKKNETYGIYDSTRKTATTYSAKQITDIIGDVGMAQEEIIYLLDDSISGHEFLDWTDEIEEDASPIDSEIENYLNTLATALGYGNQNEP